MNLENLSFDALISLVKAGNVDKDDLLRLCSTSAELNHKCGLKDQLLFKLVLQQQYGINYDKIDSHRLSPKEYLQLFKFTYQMDILVGIEDFILIQHS